MIKNDTYYKFNSKEDYIDFLETAEKDGLRWFEGQEPTNKNCINYYDGRVHFYINVYQNCSLLYGNDCLKYSTAEFWTKETTKGITATIIAHDEGIDYDKAIVTNIIKTFDRLKKEGDFKEMKIIINEPAVVLIKNGKKYVSKAHNEEFDAEKGLLMCLAKSNGISHLDLKRMLKSATYQSKEHKREPKVGDYVKIVKLFPGENRVIVGQIYKVENIGSYGNIYVSNNKYSHIFLTKYEYVVLGGYKA